MEKCVTCWQCEPAPTAGERQHLDRRRRRRPVETAHIDPTTRRYYKNGWRFLEAHETILNMFLYGIESDDIDALESPGSASNANNALRTLRRIFNKAKKDWKVIHENPRIKLLKERERTMLLDEAAEERLLPVSEQPLADTIVLMRDLGVRNAKELYPLRIEHIDWRKQQILDWRKQQIRILDSKTKAGERLVPLSHRAEAILRTRCGNRKEGRVFPFPGSRANTSPAGWSTSSGYVRA